MKIQIFALGAAIGFVAAMVPSCGGSNANCMGCLDSKGQCVTTNTKDTTCGAKGAACVDCTASSKTCSAATFSCVSGSTGGGTGTGGGSGGGAGGGSGTCDGCKLSSGTCLPGNTAQNCGKSGASCTACGTGEVCNAGTCQKDVVNRVVGSACSTDQDCATAGTGVKCRKETKYSMTPYTNGYCTKTCEADEDCPTNSTCFTYLRPYGDEPVCLGMTASACRSADGFTMYPVGCYFTDLPSLEPSTTTGNACTADTQCGPYDFDRCLTTQDGAFTGGYCSRPDCIDDTDCSTDGGAVCLSLGCVAHCAVGGEPEDGGAMQGECRSGYLCQSFTQSDGGQSADGFCFPPPPPVLTTVGDLCAADVDCQKPTGAAGICETQLADGGGYPGGHCTAECQTSADCGPNNAGICFTYNDPAGNYSICSKRCAAPKGGQSDCRTGYVCEGYNVLAADGGRAPSTDGYCDIDCRSWNWCGTYKCNANGYCTQDGGL